MAEPTQKARLLSVRSLSPAVRELVLVPTEYKISFKPGQWVSLQLPVGERPPLVRAYSMAEPESADGRLVLVLDRVPHGLGSGYLFTLKEGDEVTVAGPYGNFVIPDPVTKELVFVARYTGIVPIRCMIKHLFAGTPGCQVTLVYGGPSQVEFIYHDEFTDLASRQARFRYVPKLLTEPSRVSGQPPDGPLPEVEALASLFGVRTDILPMVCGVKTFVRSLRAYFTKLGFERRGVRYETYD